MRSYRSAISTAAVLASCLQGAALAQPADPFVRLYYYGATSVCEAPLPAHDAMLRKRPLGITNEGDATAFVSCSVSVREGADSLSAARMSFVSMGGSGVVACNLVAGNRNHGSASVLGSATVPAGGDQSIDWALTSRVSARGTFNFSCALPPGVELSRITFYQWFYGT